MSEPKKKKLPEWSGIPAARSSEAGLKARLALILSLLALSSLSGIGAMLLLITQEPPSASAPAPKEDLARGAADIVAEAFIAGAPLLGVEVADGVSFVSDGVDVVSGPFWAGSRRVPFQEVMLEEHRYSLVRYDGVEESVNELTILMLVEGEGGGSPVLAASPFMRKTDPNPVEGYSDYRDLVDRDVSLPDGARESLQRWAQAWAADDADTLRILTGDPAAGVRYLGLGGYRSAGVEVVSAIPLTTAGSWAVRTRVTLEDPFLSALFATEHRVVMDMDVTVEAAGTGNPRIVGWGPAGSAIGGSGPGPESVRVPDRGR